MHVHTGGIRFACMKYNNNAEQVPAGDSNSCDCEPFLFLSEEEEKKIGESFAQALRYTSGGGI